MTNSSSSAAQRSRAGHRRIGAVSGQRSSGRMAPGRRPPFAFTYGRVLPTKGMKLPARSGSRGGKALAIRCRQRRGSRAVQAAVEETVGDVWPPSTSSSTTAGIMVLAHYRSVQGSDDFDRHAGG